VTPPGQSVATPVGRRDSIERAVLLILQAEGTTTAHYLWDHVEPSPNFGEIRAAAGRLIDAGLAEQSLAGRHPIDDCWSITEKGRNEP
jgi:hypothetical protein